MVKHMCRSFQIYEQLLESTEFQEDQIIFPGRACMREMRIGRERH